MKLSITILTILFVALKLTGAIAWSWLWVLAPLWVPFAIGVAIYVGVMIGLVLAAVVIMLGAAVIAIRGD